MSGELLWAQELSKSNAAVNARHADGVVLVLIKLAENVKKLCVGDLRNQFNH